MEPGLVIALAAGWVGGWIVNYLADVLPITRTFSQPACLQCQQPRTWSEFLFFRTCPACGKKSGLRVWLVQIFMTGISLYTWIHPPAHLGYALGLFILIYFCMDFVIDMEHRLILHPTSVFGSLLGLAAGTVRQGLVSTLLGGLAGFAIMMFFYLLGVLFSRMRDRRLRAAGMATDDEEALGAGDVILAAILGLFLGWPMIWFGLLLGILLGGAISILLVLGLLLTRQYKENAWNLFIPYGPYLLTSAFLLMYLPTWIKTTLPN